jgi:hypothetical protein
MPSSIVKWMAVGLTGCLAALCLIFLSLWWLSGPRKPRNSDLERRFTEQRSDFEELVAMMEADKQMTRVANNFLWKLDNAAWPRPESEWGITRARWNNYKDLFRKVGSEDGTVRQEKSSDVEIIIHSWGMVTSGGSISFLHCGQPAGSFQHTVVPCFEKATVNEGSKDNTSGEAYRFKRLDRDWFIYEESD